MLNLGDLLDEIVDSFPEGAGTEEDDSIKIRYDREANVGKSSLVNRLLGEPCHRFSLSQGRPETLSIPRLKKTASSICSSTRRG